MDSWTVITTLAAPVLQRQQRLRAATLRAAGPDVAMRMAGGVPAAKSSWAGVDLQRLISSLLLEELSRLQPSALAPADLRSWAADTEFDARSLGISAEAWRQLAECVCRCFHLHETEAEARLARSKRLGDWVEVVSDRIAEHAARISFQLPADTGERRLATHQLSGLVMEADFFISELIKGNFWPERIVACDAPHHIDGFVFGVLVPARLDADLWDVQGAEPTWLRQCRAGDVVAASLEQWVAGLHGLQGARIAEGVTGILSGAAATESLSSQLRQAGLERLIEVYGSTTTSGIGWRDQAEAPFQLLPRWRRCEENPQRLLKAACAAAVSAPDRLEWLDARHFRVAPVHGR